MIVSGEVGVLQYKLQQLQKQQVEIDSQMNKITRSNAGAINIDFFRLRKQRDEVKEQLIKVSSMLKPDIIA